MPDPKTTDAEDWSRLLRLSLEWTRDLPLNKGDVALLDIRNKVPELLDRIARLETALREIRDQPEWLGDSAEYGSGHDAARRSAAEIAEEALSDG